MSWTHSHTKQVQFSLTLPSPSSVDTHFIFLQTAGVGTGFLKLKPKSDAHCVAKLRAAGAIIIGKTNMHEFGADVTNCNPSTGTPRNPYDLSRYTGGSSGGSGASVAAGFCPLAVGAGSLCSCTVH